MRNIGCACARVCSHAAEGSFLVAVFAAAYLPKLGKLEGCFAAVASALQLWQ